VLEHWIGRGTVGANNRWLKAMKDDRSLFDIQIIERCWLATNHWMAAKLFIEHASPESLREYLPEIIDRCENEKAWMIGKACIRAHPFPDYCWQLLKEKSPVTYLYTCAKVQRSIERQEAVSLVLAQSELDLPGDDKTGLAIWSLGELKMYSALQELQEMLPTLSKNIARSYERFR
jgi:hypothetical protein